MFLTHTHTHTNSQQRGNAYFRTHLKELSPLNSKQFIEYLANFLKRKQIINYFFLINIQYIL